MGFITNTDIVLINARIGLKFEAFVGYQELIEHCLLKLTDSEFAEVGEKFVKPHLKQPEILKVPGKTINKISATFLRRIQNAGCQCGRQKLENMPLCGVCFTKLPNATKENLRRFKGAELEDAYNAAVGLLKNRSNHKCFMPACGLDGKFCPDCALNRRNNEQ